MTLKCRVFLGRLLASAYPTLEITGNFTWKFYTKVYQKSIKVTWASPRTSLRNEIFHFWSEANPYLSPINLQYRERRVAESSIFVTRLSIDASGTNWTRDANIRRLP